MTQSVERVGHMCDIPTRLECAYCIRSESHGGECTGKKNNEQGCLIFKRDPKGCIRRADLKIPFKLYDNIPPLKFWENDKWVVYGKDTSIKIHSIKHLSWEKGAGILYVHADCSYYVDEFSHEYEKEQNKPKLKVIK